MRKWWSFSVTARPYSRDAAQSWWSSLILSLFQIPVFFGMYQTLSSLQNLAGVSFVWISSLAIPDAFYVLPFLVAITTYLQMKSASPSSTAGKEQAVLMTKLLPVLNFVFMAALPSALVLYYATSGVFQVVSETALRKFMV